MKCDKLESKDYNNGMTVYELLEENGLVNTAKAVKEAIAELKARIHELESMPHTDNSAVIELLEKENEDLKNELYAVKTDLAMSQRWRKCSEELPEIGVEVLVTNGIDCGISDWCGDYWNNDPFCGYTVCDNVIAWMPLPKFKEK